MNYLNMFRWAALCGPYHYKTGPDTLSLTSALAEQPFSHMQLNLWVSTSLPLYSFGNHSFPDSNGSYITLHNYYFLPLSALNYELLSNSSPLLPLTVRSVKQKLHWIFNWMKNMIFVKKCLNASVFYRKLPMCTKYFLLSKN